MVKENTKKFFGGLPWKTIATIAVLITLFGGMFSIDNRFAKSEQLTEFCSLIKKETNSAIMLSEAAAVTTFQGLQTQQLIMNKSLQLQMLHHQKEWKDKEYFNLKRQLRLHPGDKEILEEIKEVKVERIILKEKIERKILEN